MEKKCSINKFTNKCSAAARISKSLKSKTTGAHFNTKGHSISDMEITVLEKIFNQDGQFRKQREKLWIQKFNTKYRGLNRINGG